MSRCYPYLRKTGSSVVERNGNGGSSDGNLIDSFKLHSKNEKPKTEQVKEKGREKEKEKRKVRKQKDEKRDFSDGKVKKLRNDKCYREKKFKDGVSDSCLAKGSLEEKVKSLESSGLTEEHDEPMCVYLSDGTQSRKRKRDSTPSSGITVHRNILRIRLPSQKQREHDSLPNKEQLCFPARDLANSLAQKRETVQERGKEQQYCSNTCIDGELPPISDSTRKEKVDPSVSKTALGATSFENELQRTELMYQSLMDDLSSRPLLLQTEMDISDDQEWLLGTKQQRLTSKKLKASDVDVSCSQNSSMWPHAQYLPEADIYSLPYTIPF